jgi:adenosylcobinamide-GDP ribazoletransferase
MNGMLAAVMFLTRVRVPASVARTPLGLATPWFPIVGAALGLAAVGVAAAMTRFTAAPPILTALCIVALGAWITGALHLDGLADTIDGFGGARDRDKVLAIMRDPRTGSFAVVALVLVIGIKANAIAELLRRNAYAGLLIAAPALSRWTVAPLGWWLPYARQDHGLGAAVTRSQTLPGVFVTTGVALAISFAAAGTRAVPLWGVATAITACAGMQARRRLGGVTGDVFGACVELVETGALTMAVLLP